MWVGAAAASVAVLAGCGQYNEANSNKAQDPVTNVRPPWVRIDTPANYPTVVHGCYQHNGHWMGIYLNQDSSNTTTVVTNDPTCPLAGTR